MLIYIPKLTNRMGYTLNVVFHHLLQIDYSITTDAELYRTSNDIRFCYGTGRIDNSPFLHSCGLLFTSAIEDQDLRPFDHNGLTALFPVHNRESMLPFDVLAATFFLLSRYEEYLPHHIDEFGRFPASESVAYRHGFLNTPIVDHWAQLLYKTLQQHYPALPDIHRRSGFEVTVDIDAAYCYRHKGVLRTLTGLTRDLIPPTNRTAIQERLQVLSGRKQDPFDTFDYLLQQHRSHPGVKMLFFALLGDYGQYDKPISHANTAFRELLQFLGDHAKMGIHASFQSADNPRLIKVETQRLSDILHRPIVRNRFHYLRLQLPQSYRRLTHEDILHDYTMGYADEPGFRAGTATPYPFYDLERDEECPLIIHPFCVMDTTLIRHKNLSPSDAFDIYCDLIDKTRAADGTFSVIWHNQNLCDNTAWRSWRDLLKQVLDYGCANQ